MQIRIERAAKSLQKRNRSALQLSPGLLLNQGVNRPDADSEYLRLQPRASKQHESDRKGKGLEYTSRVDQEVTQ